MVENIDLPQGFYLFIYFFISVPLHLCCETKANII